MTVEATGAAGRWRDALARWAIPDEILAAAPASPWGYSVPVFARAADAALLEDSPSVRRAREALPADGTVLDVGCGVGAASLPLADRIGRLIGVDEDAAMLSAFGRRARAAGIAVETVRGRWPDVADEVGIADITVCRNVAYNVADLAPFVRALTAHSVQRVVLELTDQHPLAWMNPYWRDLHGLDRPDEPTAADAVAVVSATGVTDLEVHRWVRTADRVDCAGRSEPDEELARRLCLGRERLDDVRAARSRHGVPVTRSMVTVAWAGEAAPA